MFCGKNVQNVDGLWCQRQKGNRAAVLSLITIQWQCDQWYSLITTTYSNVWTNNERGDKRYLHEAVWLCVKYTQCSAASRSWNAFYAWKVTCPCFVCASITTLAQWDLTIGCHGSKSQPLNCSFSRDRKWANFICQNIFHSNEENNYPFIHPL